MTGKEISEEIDKLNKDINTIFNVMINLESQIARDEWNKVLVFLGTELKKKNETDYCEVGELELNCSKEFDKEIIKFGEQNYRIKACKLDSPIKHRRSDAEKEMSKPISKRNYYDSL